MATVYLAEDLKHRRQVAVKVLRPELAVSLGVERFVREIEVAAQLHHPHILPLYDSGEADGFLFYVMPYEAGQSLRDRLQKETELPIRDVTRLLRDVADALAHAHHHGLVHRDIKPENVMLSGQHALVTDFGVAKAVSDATGRQQVTTAGVALGTPAYMSPEQAAADPQIDHRADIYALGVLGYELVAGQAPFAGSTPQAVLAAHITQIPKPVAQYRSGVPVALAGLIMRCLEKRPADRYQTVAEMLPILEILSAPTGGATPAATVRYRSTSRGGAWRLAAGGGGVLLIGALGWAGWRVFHSAQSTLAITDIRQVTREPEPEIHVAVSPDGREVAYESGYPGHTHIVVRDVAGGRPLTLTGDWQGAQVLPRWTPDGQAIVFRNIRTTPDHAAGLWKLPRLGGQAVAPDSADAAALAGGRTVTVGVDSLFALDATSGDTLYRIGLAGVHSLAWRRDGSALAYVSGNERNVYDWGNTAPSAIWVAPAGGAPVRVTDDLSQNLSPAWLPDGTLLFVSDREGARDVYAVHLDRAGAPRERPVRLTTGLEAYSVSVSADGHSAAYDRFVFQRNIYTVPIPTAGVISLRGAQPITRGNQKVENLDLSEDGQWLAFDSNLEGNQDIYVMPATGGEPRRVTRDPAADMVPDFSPDGREIVFHSTRHGNRTIYLIRTDGTDERRLTTDSLESYNPAFSPDGLRVAYGTSDQHLYLLWRDSLGAPWQGPRRLPVDVGYAPRWSPDGTRLVYDIRKPPGGLGVFQMAGAPKVLVTEAGAGLVDLKWPEWTGDGKWIYFRAVGPDGVEGVYEIPATGGTPRLLVRFDDPAMPAFGGGVLAGNGLFYFAIAQTESDIYVMDLVTK